MLFARRLAARPLPLQSMGRIGALPSAWSPLAGAWVGGRAYCGPRGGAPPRVRGEHARDARKAEERECRAYGAIEKFRREGEVEKMLQRMMQYLAENKQVTERMFLSMLTAFVDSGRKVDARRILADRARFGLQGRLTEAEEELMLKLECKTRDRAAAERAFERMGRGGRKRSLRAYGMLLTVLAKEGDAQAAEELVAGMDKDCVQPDRVAWNLLLQAHARAGSKEGAASVLQRMEEAKCKADKRTFRHLVGAHVNAGDLEGAEKVLEDHLRETDGVAVALLMKGLCEAGRAKEAEAIVLEMAKLATVDKAHRVPRLDAAAAAVLEHGWLPLKQGKRAASLVLEKLPAVQMPLSDRIFELALEACRLGGDAKKRKELLAKQRLLQHREEEKAAKAAGK